MTIQALVSTMNQKNYDLLEKMNIQTDAIVVNQCDKSSIEDFKFRNNKIKWINTTDRGLSKSRNLALRYASADICLVADDDMVYRNGFETLVLNAFEINKEVSIIRFKLKGINQNYKNYPDKACKIGYLLSMKTSSVEIAFKRKNVVDNGIFFNELLGAGAEFYLGEENDFLFKCLNKKMKMLFVPEVIADLYLGDSSWFRGHTEQYFLSKGAAFAAFAPQVSELLILVYAIRRFKLYKAEYGFVGSIKAMRKGKREYIKLLKS